MRRDWHRWVMVSENHWNLYYMVDLRELRNRYEKILIGLVEKVENGWRGRLHPSFKMYVEPVGPLKMVANMVVDYHFANFSGLEVSASTNL